MRPFSFPKEEFGEQRGRAFLLLRRFAYSHNLSKLLTWSPWSSGVCHHSREIARNEPHFCECGIVRWPANGMWSTERGQRRSRAAYRNLLFPFRILTG